MTDRVAPTACILVLGQLRPRGPHRRADDHPGARRQGASRLGGLHVREGSAHRPLPERPAPADDAIASAPRRHVRGDRLGHRDRRGRRSASSDVIAEHGGDKILFYGGGGQGNHLGGGYGERDAVGARHHATRPTPSPRRRPASSGSTASCSAARAATPPATTSTPRSPCSGARTRGSRTASRRPAGSSRRSPTIPTRTLIVVDPRRTESADLADIHLRPLPGGDADLLAALLAVLVEDACSPTAGWPTTPTGSTSWSPTCARIDVAESCAQGGRRRGRRAPRRTRDRHRHRRRVDLRRPRHPDGAALDAQQLPREAGRAAHRQLRGARRHEPPHQFTSLARRGGSADGIAADHTRHRSSARHRSRAVQRDPRRDPHRPSRPLPGDARSSRAIPVHSLADSQRMREAMDALDLVVVIDVALTETAREADYVLPAASQYEKWECTFFNLEFPHNVLPPPPPAVRATRRARCPSTRSTPACAGRSACTPMPTSSRCAPPPSSGAPPSPTRSSTSASPSPSSGGWRRCCCTRRSGRR